MPHFKRRLRNRALYYHSSPPKVLGMSVELAGKVGQDPPPKEVVNIKPSNIRIWIHDKDIPKLTKVLWSGQGMKLRSEISTHPRMRKFLEAVPYILNVIKDTHTACIDNDLDTLMKRTAHPVPPIVLSTKDQNGLTALHKAAGLAHTKAVEYLLSVWPEAAMDVDDTGKLPLHWAAAAKNNERTFNLLVQAGADETATDNKMKAAEYYKQRPNEIDRSLLTVIPEAPRIAQTVVPDFDWSIITEPSKWAGIQTRASHKKSTSLNLGTNDKSTALDGRRGVQSEKASFSVISRNGSLSSDNIDTASDGHTSVTTPETVEVNGHKSESEIQSVPIPEEEETMPANLHEAAARSVASVAPSAIFARSAKHTEASKRPPTPHYRVIEDNLANGSSAAATESDANENDGEEEQNLGISVITSPEKGDLSQPEDTSDHGDPTLPTYLDTVEEKSLEGAEVETITMNSEVNNNEEFALESKVEVKDEPVTEDDSVIEEQQPGEESVMVGETVEKTEGNDPEMEKSSGIKSPMTDDDAPKADAQSVTSMAEANSINRVPSAKHDDIEGVNAISETPGERVDVGEGDKDDEELQERSEEPPGGVMEIEGIVQGEPATGQQSEGGNRVDDENDDEPIDQRQTDKIRAAIKGSDMEYLAAIVLDGQGGKLIGLETTQPDIQAFLDNVPAYMSKIRRVHIAAREGNLRDLQSALDRRKFAIAKDEISPNGASPLHVATIFGHTGIVRYLAGRFPETMTAVDDQDRTPLHYAATIHDNGHFYNLLVHMGANSKALDKEGNPADFYMMHDRAEKILSHKQLLRNFGVQDQMADEMLNDQDMNNSGNGNLLEIPLFRTEEGRYLATSLGDPLIKGLTEVANQRPDNPITFLANYLHNFVNTANADEKNQMVATRIDPKEGTSQVAGRIVIDSIAAEAVPTTPSPDGDELSGAFDRDEHGQSMLHFACARSHGRNALFHLIEESGVSISFRDELYRTARDVAIQASQAPNTKELDRYVIALAARGDIDAFQAMLLDGYDHILDPKDGDGNSIVSVAQSRGHNELVKFLESIMDFEERREKCHTIIREEDLEKLKELLDSTSDAIRLMKARNYYGRTALHIAVLKEKEDIVEYIVTNFRATIKIGDNLERTPLHYAMGVSAVEAISRILIKNGAKRVVKDLKGRQPSYYFMNKSDILRLQEEENH